MSILWYQIHSTDTLYSYNCPQRPSFQHSSPLPSRAILSMNALKGHFLTQLCTALLEHSFHDYLQSHSCHHCPLLSLYRASISMIAFQSIIFLLHPLIYFKLTIWIILKVNLIPFIFTFLKILKIFKSFHFLFSKILPVLGF